MLRTRRRLLVLLIGVVVYLILVSVAYQFGMAVFEGKPRTFLQSVEWAADTFTTTGYGRDTTWSHPFMIGLVMLVQFSGMVAAPLIIALFVLPFFAERFEQRLPRIAGASLAEHVIVYRYGPAVEMLLQRLRDRAVPTLVAETDEQQARNAMERGQAVVFSRSDDDILDACRVSTARAIVANGRDEENAGVILRARQMGFRGEVFAFVEDPAHRKPIELAGATSTYTPRHIIAAALAAHASDTLSPRLPGIESLPSLQRREVRVLANSPVAGKTLRDSAIGARSGAVVVGQWCGSRLDTRCTADMRVEANAVIEIVGDDASIARAVELIGGPLLRQSGPFLIAGFGEVGRKVHELLRDAGEEVRVVERREAPDVDIVGDVLDSSVLARAGINESRGIVLALDSDDATLFATVIARDTAPDIPVIARVNHARNVANIHRAGADFALSISDVSGEMLSARLLGRTRRAREEHRRVERIAASRWIGRSVHDLPLRPHGCSALALERDGALITRLTADLRVQAGDSLWVTGTAEAVHKVA
jgi:Trk K+ transport system NAD-binding subunit